MSSGAFPFGAVVGQADAQLALLLAAVDPGIGGVLLRGDKGSAKSTLARGLAGLLPPGAPFVELPVGATEDRVVGGLDLGEAFAGAASLRPGLLSAAHGGVLYVDEVNLLPDHLVDLLLDAAASGVHHVERDGLSHTAPARFVLVGSMNPEEGELRPQLLDRFGLAVEVRSPREPAWRAAAVRNRLEFDAGRLGARVSREDEELAARLAVARPASLPDDVIAHACRLAVAAGAEGLRADLVLCRAAAALAGWEGRDLTATEDVNRVAALALAHRRRRRPFDPPTMAAEDLAKALSEATQSAAPPAAPPAVPPAAGGPGPGPGGPTPRSKSGDAGLRRSDSDAVSARWADLSHADLYDAGLLPALPIGAASPVGPARPEWTVGPEVRGPQVGERVPGPGGPVAVAVAASVRASLRRRAAAPQWAVGSVGSVDSVGLVGDDLREPLRRRAQRQCTILVVDTSGSMGVTSRVEAATGAVLSLLADAYRRRHRVALVACRGMRADVVLPPTASVELARARLRDLPTGGATPLAEGIDAALAVARAVRRDDDHPTVVLLTDGRATSGADALGRARAAARELAGEGIATLVLDAEDGPARLGIAAELADAAGGRCVPLAAVTADAVESAIRAAETRG
ncbi:MAG TPA: VWA domain-containing protein [Acidimicrobiales bacterium]